MKIKNCKNITIYSDHAILHLNRPECDITIFEGHSFRVKYHGILLEVFSKEHNEYLKLNRSATDKVFRLVKATGECSQFYDYYKFHMPNNT